MIEAGSALPGHVSSDSSQAAVRRSDLRVHAWVLVRNSVCDLHVPLLIEPSTGSVFGLDSAPYCGVEAIWNHNNYWINMQGLDKAMNELVLDLNDQLHWEFVLPEQIVSRHEDEANWANAIATANISTCRFEIPSSWVSKLQIDQNELTLRFPPDGQRTIFYSQAKLELFAGWLYAPTSRRDLCGLGSSSHQGMTSRLFVYLDRGRRIVKEAREVFASRQDKLISRTRCPLNGEVLETFQPGRSFSLQRLLECTGRYRDMHFFVEGRQDGLFRRTDIVGQKIVERFMGRPDGLSYRSVSVTPDDTTLKPQYSLPGGESAGDLVVHKMTQKFIPWNVNGNISKRTYYVQEAHIRTQYHHDDSRVTRQDRVHTKECHVGAAAHTTQRAQVSLCISEKGSSSHQKVGAASSDMAPMLFENPDVLQPVLAAERDCLTEVRRSQLETIELLKLRKREEMCVVLDRPAMDKVCDLRSDSVREEIRRASWDLDGSLRVDYLTPFLRSTSEVHSMSCVEAQHAHDSCLRSLKERLIERANIIMTRLNEENSKLAKRQAT